MEIILITEENHGLIGVAETRTAAINYLIKDSWITEKTELLDEYECTRTLEEMNISLDDVREMSISKFNEIFEGIFYLGVDNLIS